MLLFCYPRTVWTSRRGTGQDRGVMVGLHRETVYRGETPSGDQPPGQPRMSASRKH